MKKINYLFAAAIFSVFAIMTSCSKSDDDHGCHECHIALEMADGTEMMWDIVNSSGGDEFCGEELTTVESPSYMHSISDTLYCTMGSHALPPGEYGADNGYEIHCEEHGDHDH